MSVHQAWGLACQLFASGAPARHCSFTPEGLGTLRSLGKAIKRVALDHSFVLCPYCGEQAAQVVSDGGAGRMCRCPSCGPVELRIEDFVAYALDEEWLQRSLRLALEIQSRDGVDRLADGVWRLGEARNAPVILTRNLAFLWCEPSLLDRVRVPGVSIRVISPTQSELRGLPFGHGVEWLPLEERFALYGGGIMAVGIDKSTSSTRLAEPAVSNDPAAPLHGPFSEDFRWVTVPGVQAGPIKLTNTQAAVFKALWSFDGQATFGHQVMRRAGSKSTKPGDVFKGRRYIMARLAFGALVTIDHTEGLYAMACARSLLR